MTTGSLDFFNNLFVRFVLHFFEYLCFHICFLELLASFERHEVLLADVKEWVLVVNGFVSDLILDHIGNGLSVLDFRAERDIVMLVALEFIVERVEHVLLDYLGRHRQSPEIISALRENVLLPRLELIYSQWLAVYSLLHLLVRIVATEGDIWDTRLVTLSQIFQTLYWRLVIRWVLWWQTSSNIS